MTDRDRVELVLIPRLMRKVVIDGVRRERDPGAFDRIVALLEEAERAPIADMPLPAQAKIVRRVERIMWSAISPYETTDKLGLVVFCLLKLMTDSGYLEIGEASALWRAAQMFMDGLEEAAQEDALFRSAEKGARKTLAHLRKERLFDRMEVMAA